MNPAATQQGPPGETFLVPCDVVWFKDRPLVGFAEIESEELRRPFWRQTVKERRLTALRPLEDIQPEPSAFRLAGMIHHMGRCGSTLLATLLSTLPGVYVLREPETFVDILDKSHGTAQDRSGWARNLAAAYGNAFGDRLQHLVIKWSPLQSLFADEIAAAFPAAPALFLYRDPVEVLVSLCETPSKMVDGYRERFFPDDVRPAGCESVEPQSYPDKTASMIAALCDTIRRAGSTRTLDYLSLPQAAWEKAAPFFGLEISGEERLRMAEMARFYSKSAPGKRAFEDNSPAKQSRADETIRGLACRIVEPRLDRLKAELQPL